MKLTTALIAAAVALYAFSARNGRSSRPATASGSAGPKPTGQISSPRMAGGDPGIILRNEPIDNGMVIRSPFGGDPGIVKPPREDASGEVSS